jgi:hypothetical protein
MAIKMKTSGLKFEGSNPAVVSSVAPTPADVSLDSLKRSLSSLKFIPLVSEANSYDANELEFARAKAVLDQMSQQAEELISKEDFIQLMKDAVKASDIDVSPDILEQMAQHIRAKTSWMRDIKDMPTPEHDSSEELVSTLLEMHDKDGQVPPANSNILNELKKVVQQQAAPALEGEVLTTDVQKSKITSKIETEIDRIDAENERLAGQEILKKKDLIQDLVQDKNLSDNPVVQQTQKDLLKAENKFEPKTVEIEPNSVVNEQGKKPSNFNQVDPNMYRPGHNQGGSGFSMNFGFGDALKTPVFQKDPAKALHAASKDLQRTLNDASYKTKYQRDLENLMEETHKSSGHDIELDDDGRWSLKTVMDMEQNEALKDLQNKHDKATADLAAAGKKLEKSLDNFEKATINNPNVEDDDLENLEKAAKACAEELSNGSKHINKQKEAEQNQELLNKLRIMIDQLVNKIRELLGLKKPSNENSERVEPSFSPQP